MIHITDIINHKLLATGQLTQYGGYPDDGFYRMGAAKEYDILDLGVYSGHTHIILNAKDDDRSNNCVYDRRTKLMWSRFMADHVGPTNNGKLPWTTNVNGEGIFAYCAVANAALLAGYLDWRVPNLFEFFSLNDHEAPTPLPDAAAFPGWPSNYVWSSTTVPNINTDAFTENFANGSVECVNKVGNYANILVRGG